MKRGDTLRVKVVECQQNGLLVFVQERKENVLLPAEEIVGGIKKKHLKMIGQMINVRVKSLRPFAISGKRVNLNKVGTSEESDNSKPKPLKSSKNFIPKMSVSVAKLPYGFMVWWKKNDNAARYFIRLFVCKAKSVYDNFKREYKNVIEESDEITVIEIERNTAFYTFTNLAQLKNQYDRYGRREDTGLSYFVKVETENREGKIIACSEMTQAVID